MSLLNNDSADDKELMSIFQTESEEIVDRIMGSLFALEKKLDDKELVASLYRDMHSLKGAVRMVGFNNIQNLIHKMEDIFDAVNQGELYLEKEIIDIISRTVDLVSKYIHQSIQNSREIIDEDFQAFMSNLEYILEVEIAEFKP